MHACRSERQWTVGRPREEEGNIDLGLMDVDDSMFEFTAQVPMSQDTCVRACFVHACSEYKRHVHVDGSMFEFTAQISCSYLCVCMCLCMCVYIYIYTHLYMCVCVFVCIHILIYIRAMSVCIYPYMLRNT